MTQVFLESQSATAQADAPDLYFWTVWGESRTEELRMQARLASDGTEFRALPDYSLAGHHWMSLALDQGRDGLFLSLVPTRFGRGALPARLTAPRLLAQAGILPSDVAVATQGLVPRAAKALAQRREDRALLLFIAFDISYGHESLRATDETMQSLLVRGSDGPSRKRLVVLYQEPQGQGARAVVTGLPGRMAGEIEEEPMSEEQFQALLFPPPVSE